MAIVDTMTPAQIDRLMATTSQDMAPEDRKATRAQLAQELGCSPGTIDRAIYRIKAQQGQQPEAVTSLPSTLPLLGYAVSWDLDGGQQMSHADLSELLIQTGFADYDPGLPSEKANLQRAIGAWVKDTMRSSSSQPGAKEASLIRKIDDRSLDHTTWAILLEHADLDQLSLDHSTTVRVSLEKVSKADRAAGKQSVMTVSATARGSVLAQASEAMTTSLAAYWQQYQDSYTVGGLSGLLTTLVKSMQGSPLRAGGGMYIVPQSQHEALARLQSLARALPGDNAIIALPIVDDEKARQQLATGLYRGLIQELETMTADLDRLDGRQLRAGGRAVADRIVGFKAIKAKAQEFSSTLGQHMADIDSRVQALTTRAQAMIEQATSPEAPEAPQPEQEPEAPTPQPDKPQELDTSDPAIAGWHAEAQTPPAPEAKKPRGRIKAASIV